MNKSQLWNLYCNFTKGNNDIKYQISSKLNIIVEINTQILKIYSLKIINKFLLKYIIKPKQKQKRIKNKRIKHKKNKKYIECEICYNIFKGYQFKQCNKCNNKICNYCYNNMINIKKNDEDPNINCPFCRTQLTNFQIYSDEELTDDDYVLNFDDQNNIQIQYINYS
jgi:Zn finger protein HypA/HybF involved in hydrogenase expression